MMIKNTVDENLTDIQRAELGFLDAAKKYLPKDGDVMYQMCCDAVMDMTKTNEQQKQYIDLLIEQFKAKRYSADKVLELQKECVRWCKCLDNTSKVLTKKCEENGTYLLELNPKVFGAEFREQLKNTETVSFTLTMNYKDRCQYMVEHILCAFLAFHVNVAISASSLALANYKKAVDKYCDKADAFMSKLRK